MELGIMGIKILQNTDFAPSLPSLYSGVFCSSMIVWPLQFGFSPITHWWAVIRLENPFKKLSSGGTLHIASCISASLTPVSLIGHWFTAHKCEFSGLTGGVPLRLRFLSWLQAKFTLLFCFSFLSSVLEGEKMKEMEPHWFLWGFVCFPFTSVCFRSVKFQGFFYGKWSGACSTFAL